MKLGSSVSLPSFQHRASQRLMRIIANQVPRDCVKVLQSI